VDTSTKLEIVCFIPDYNGEFANFLLKLKKTEEGRGRNTLHRACQFRKVGLITTY
jgi:hypothetical protein